MDLNFLLGEDVTEVHSVLAVKPNYQSATVPDLVLHRGRAVELKGLRLNGKEVPATQYTLTDKHLTVHQAGSCAHRCPAGGARV